MRPRTGDFLYSEEEFDIMLEDASMFIENGVAGVVAGFLTLDGGVDALKTTRYGWILLTDLSRLTFKQIRTCR